MDYSSQRLRQISMSLLAFCLTVCANSARGQVYAPNPNGQAAFAGPGGSSYEVQQPPGVYNYGQGNPMAGGATTYSSTCQSAEWPQWYISAESLFLWRDNRYPSDLADDFGVGVGPRVFVGARPDGDWELQAGYFGAFGMEASSNHPPDGISSSPSTINLTSELNSAEINFLGNFNNFALLAGFRYLGFNDTFDFRFGQDTSSVYNGEYKTSVKNNLYGGQLGLRWRFVQQQFFLEATGKAGIFGNNAQADGFIQATDGFQSLYNEFPTVVGRHTAFVGDLNFTAALRISPIWLARAGYNLLWLNSIALAPDRATTEYYTAESFPLSLDRPVFMHGASVGLEAAW